MQCPKCEQETLLYDYKDHCYLCECGYEYEEKPHKRKCFSCGETYLEYTFFDPSGCNRCHKSFVD